MIFYLENSDTEQYSTIKILAVIVILTSIKNLQKFCHFLLEHDKKFFLEGCLLLKWFNNAYFLLRIFCSQ